jgi:hypothetical protein
LSCLLATVLTAGSLVEVLQELLYISAIRLTGVARDSLFQGEVGEKLLQVQFGCPTGGFRLRGSRVSA